MVRSRTVVALLALAACHSDPVKPPRPPGPAAGAVTVTVLGTQDLHGALERLPILAGYVDDVRAARAAGMTRAVEAPPGLVLTGLMGKIDPAVEVKSVPNADAFAAFSLGSA